MTKRKRPSIGHAASSTRENEFPVLLVVEDEPRVRLPLTNALVNFGLVVVEADRPEVAMEALKSNGKIRAVIAEAALSGTLDGVGLVSWMKEHTQGIPVVLLAGAPLPDNLSKLNPAIAIVVKPPYDPTEVAEWVTSLVKVA